MLVLAEEGDHPAAERLEVGCRGGAALNERARAALCADPTGEHDLVELLAHALAQFCELGLLDQPRRQLEDALHVGLRRARPDNARARLAAQEQVERVGEHGLPGTGLSRDRREPVARPQLRPLDQVLYRSSSSTAQVYQRDPTESLKPQRSPGTRPLRFRSGREP